MRQPQFQAPDRSLSRRVRLASLMASYLREVEGDDDAHPLDLLDDEDVDSLGDLDTEVRESIRPGVYMQPGEHKEH